METYRSVSRETRVILGCIATPFAAAATMFGAALVFAPLLGAGNSADRFDQPASMAIGVWFLAVIVTAVAAPVVMSTMRQGPVSLRHVLSVGAAFGVLPIALSMAITTILAVPSRTAVPLPMTVTSPVVMTGLGFLIGICSAGTFWAVALRDREAPHRQR